jgi:hypothetical protein
MAGVERGALVMLMRDLKPGDRVITPTQRPAKVSKRLDEDRVTIRYIDERGGTADVLEYLLRPSYTRGPNFRNPR